MKIIGADIGGTHITTATLELNGNQFEVNDLADAHVDTYGASDQIIASWAEVIRKSAGDSTEFSLGIAMPGPFDYREGVSLIQDQGKMKSLYGLSVRNLLAEELGIPPTNIQFTNDAEAFLLGEIMQGTAGNSKRVLGITLGTGLGSAFFLNGKSQDAKLWTAAFRNGVAEDFLGTGWFVNQARSRIDLEIRGVRELIELDSSCSESLFQEFGLTFGEFLLPYLSEYEFEQVVLGGKISFSAKRFLPFTHQFLQEHGRELPIKLSQLGEQAALIGACFPFFETVNFIK